MHRIFLCISLLFNLAPCFSQLMSIEEHEAWLDSIAKESFVANSILLDEVDVHGIGTKQGDVQAYLRGNSLTSVDDFIHRVPGLNMSRKGNYANEPLMRGLDINRMVVNIDGMRIQPACTDRMDPVTSYMEPNNMGSMEVEKGSDGFKGSSSTGHCLNFTQKAPSFDRERPIKGSIGMRYGTVANEFSQMGDLDWNRNKSSVRFNFVHRRAGNYYGGNRTLVENSSFNKLNFGLGFAQQMGKSNMLKINYLHDDAWDIGYPALPMDVSKAQARMVSASFLRSFGPSTNHHLDFKVYYNKIVHIMDDSKRENVVMHMDMPGETQTYGSLLSLQLNPSERTRINSKLEYFNTYSFAEMTMYPEGESSMYMQTWPGIRYTGVSGAIDMRRQLGATYSLVAGARVELASMYMEEEFGEDQFRVFAKENPSDELHTLPSIFLGLDKEIGSAGIIGIRTSYGVRLPNNSEKFGFFIFNSTDMFDYMGDPDLKNETSYKIDLNYNYKSKKLDFGISQFNYFFQDYILGIADTSLDAMTPGARGVKYYSNTSTARLHGIEFFGHYFFSDRVSTLATINYTYGNDFEGQPLPFIPPLKISYSNFVSLGKIKVQPEVVFAAVQNRVSEKNVESPTPSFWLFNFHCSREYELKGSTLSARIGLENIFDNYYREHIDWGDIPRPGRNLYVDLSWRF